MQVQLENDRREQKITITYLGVEYDLRLPPKNLSRDRHISTLADQMLNDPDNEALIKAVVKHENQFPAVVARVQGQSIRQASRAFAFTCRSWG